MRTIIILIMCFSFIKAQTITTHNLWNNQTKTSEFEAHNFNINYGGKENVFWYYSPYDNEVFTRVTDIIYDTNRDGELYKYATYVDKANNIVVIQYYTTIKVIRFIYLNGLVLEFY